MITLDYLAGPRAVTRVYPHGRGRQRRRPEAEEEARGRVEPALLTLKIEAGDQEPRKVMAFRRWKS